MPTHHTQGNLVQSAVLLDAFAAVLEHPELPESIVAMLADELGDLGGARYGSIDGVPAGARFTAHFAREMAAGLRLRSEDR